MKSQPADGSRLTIGSPTFYPGLAPDTSPPAAGDASIAASSLIIGKDGGSTQIRISATDIEIGAGATNPAAKGEVTDANFSALNSLLGQMVTVLEACISSPGTKADPTGAVAAALATYQGQVAATAASIAKVK